MEVLSWRTFQNRREAGSFVGLTPTPYASGLQRREQGISKVGPPALRALLVQPAWQWRRHQPHSALTRWYETRFGGGGPRARRIGIVALARKLWIALWRFVVRRSPFVARSAKLLAGGQDRSVSAPKAASGREPNAGSLDNME